MNHNRLVWKVEAIGKYKVLINDNYIQDIDDFNQCLLDSDDIFNRKDTR